MQETINQPDPAGFHVNTWCRLVGISRAKFYTLPADLAPQTVHIGDRRLVIESPAAYLRRIAAMQAHDNNGAA